MCLHVRSALGTGADRSCEGGGGGADNGVTKVTICQCTGTISFGSRMMKQPAQCMYMHRDGVYIETSTPTPRCRCSMGGAVLTTERTRTKGQATAHIPATLLTLVTFYSVYISRSTSNHRLEPLKQKQCKYSFHFIQYLVQKV